MTAATETLEPGTLVRAPRYQNGESTGLRRGVILRTFADNGDPKSGYLVYFYTLGAAHEDGRGDNRVVGLVFPRELTTIGTLDDMSERTLLKVGKGLRDWATGAVVWHKAARVYARKRNARREAAHA